MNALATHDPSAFYDNDLSALPLADHDSLPQPTLPELWRSGVDLARDDRSNAERDRIANAYKPILEILNEGRPRRIWRSDADDRHAYANPGQWSPYGETGAHERDQEEALIWREIARRRAADPKFLPDVPATLDEFHKKITDEAIERRGRAGDTASRNQTWLGTGVRFLGGAAESFDDPLTVATLPIGGAGKTVAKRILLEGVANAATAMPALPILAKRRGELGETLTAGEAVTDVVTAGAVGSGFQGLIAEPVGAIARHARAKLGKRMTPAENAAANTIEREEEVAAGSPFKPGADTEEHTVRLERARTILNDDAPATADAGVEKPVHADPNARASFKAHVRRAESGGNDAARPIDPKTGKPLSSAFGRYQFTNKTWLSYYRRRFGAKETRAAILAKKRDGAIQEILMDDLTADNARALASIGAPETAGNLYLMHFLGEPDGRRVLQASPDTPLARLLSADAIAANRKVLAGRNAGDVIAWAHGRMNEAAPTGPTLRRALFDSDDEWAAAQRQVADEDSALARADQQSADLARDVEAPRMAEAESELPDVGKFEEADEGLGVILRAPYVAERGEPGVRVESQADGLGYAAWRDAEGVARGALVFPTDKARKADGRTVFVDPEFRRQGIATSLYDAAKAAGFEVDRASGGFTTPEGAAFLRARKRRLDAANPSKARPARPGKPKDLIRFLAERGGIRNDEGHDLIAGRGLQRFVPGRGQLIRKSGLPLDMAREAAAEAGYFHSLHPDAAVGETTVADFLDLLEQAHREPHYARADLGDIAERDLEEAWRLDQEMRAEFEANDNHADYDDPYQGAGALAAMQSMEHDLRMLAADNPDATMRASEERGDERISDVLADLDADDAALSAARQCMSPRARAA